jgi:8-oxo-dGTP pyrophosphatase MutT (NUDIX family)
VNRVVHRIAPIMSNLFSSLYSLESWHLAWAPISSPVVYKVRFSIEKLEHFTRNFHFLTLVVCLASSESCLFSSGHLFGKMTSEIEVSTDEQQDKAFAIAPELSHLKVTLNGFLKENRNVNRLVVSALIFCQERLLVIQRAKTDTFPGYWEVPGGMCAVDDETIFHGLARKVYEEVSLRVVEVKSMIGSGIQFETPGKRFKRQWLKLSFEVNVAETEPNSNGSPADYRHVKVLLNPEEHQEFCVAEERGS